MDSNFKELHSLNSHYLHYATSLIYLFACMQRKGNDCSEPAQICGYFLLKTPGFSNCDLHPPPSSSTDSEPETSGFGDSSSQGSTSPNVDAEYANRSFPSVNKDSAILEYDQNSETEKLLDELINLSKYVDPDLFLELKNERVMDRRVLKKWLWKLCQAIFNPQNPLFFPCPDDPTSFFPNLELELQPVHLDCMRFTSKAIALALRHKIQVGVAFDRVFLLQLAGKNITVEDVKDADPSLYKRCINILNMDDAEFAAQELSSGNVLEIFPGGGSNNCKDKKAYVNHLIQSQFVTSIAKQVSLFAQGFDSVFGKSVHELLSIGELEVQEDLNRVLRGSRNAGQFHRKRKSVTHNQNGSDSSMSRFEKTNPGRFNFKNWQKGHVLGGGSFGPVYEVLAGEGLFLAVKEVPLVDDITANCIEKEIALLSQLRHQNLVEFIGTRKVESNLYIFFELVRGRSLDKVYEKFHLEDSLVSFYTRKQIEGLKYLHDHKVIHRAIKCANILVDEKGCVKFTKFGLAQVIEQTSLKLFRWETHNWMAPEVIISGVYGFEADIWSLGCTVLEMLTRDIPYSYLEFGAVAFNIVKSKLPHLPNSLSRDFVLQCLQNSPKDRPTAAQLLEHPFVKGSCS